MADENQETKKSKPLTFAGLTALAQALDSKQAHTSFGKLPLSVEKTSEIYGFPQATRDDHAKVYLGELTKQENIGKNSPDELYMYEDKIKYKEAPKFSFAQQPRVPEEKPKYDFYENALFLDDPIQADLNRKSRTCAPKIGTEPRMQPNSLEQNPGPQYYPKEKPEFKKVPHYTFGFKRGGSNALKNLTSTPGAVGPGRYVPEASANPSQKQNMPRWTLPKASRPEGALRFDKNQTYDTRSGFGGQTVSKNRTAQKAHFGSSGRDQTRKLGTFKDTMQGGMSVKCYHPRF